MAMYILLTPAQAAIVTGPSVYDPNQYITPILRANNTYILPVTILANPVHQLHYGFLIQLPQMDSDDPNFPASLDEEV
jgi:hypothetical protein